MRQTILKVVVMALCGAAQLIAQPRPSHPIPPHGPVKAPKPTVQQGAGAAFDATNLGSPLALDKNWRVGITADPAAASPGFDDSGWAVRGAQSAMAEVSDKDQDEDSASRGIHVQVGPGNPRPLGPDRSLRYAWFRLHIQLAPGHGPVALLIEVTSVARAPGSSSS